MKKVEHTSGFPFGIYWWTLKNHLKNQSFVKMKKKNKRNRWRYHHFTDVYQKPQSYEVQFLRYGVRNNFFVILGHLLPFYSPHPLTTKKNKILKKMKKASGDVIISNLCNKKHDHMMYAYSDMECDRENVLSF